MEALLDEAQRSYPDQPAGPDDRWWLPAHLGGTAPTPEEAARRGRRPRRGQGGDGRAAAPRQAAAGPAPPPLSAASLHDDRRHQPERLELHVVPAAQPAQRLHAQPARRPPARRSLPGRTTA